MTGGPPVHIPAVGSPGENDWGNASGQKYLGDSFLS